LPFGFKHVLFNTLLIKLRSGASANAKSCRVRGVLAYRRLSDALGSATLSSAAARSIIASTLRKPQCEACS